MYRAETYVVDHHRMADADAPFQGRRGRSQRVEPYAQDYSMPFGGDPSVRGQSDGPSAVIHPPLSPCASCSKGMCPYKR